jgi:hypothetical protein
MKSLLLISLLVFNVACGKKASSSKKQVNQIFVKGNPLTMINGTQKNRASFISSANTAEFNNYALGEISIFTEKELMTPAESEDIESGNEAESTDQTTDAAKVFNMKTSGVNKFDFADTAGKISFGFNKNGTVLDLTSIKLGDSRFSSTMEHYSLSADKSKMSFLFRLATSGDGNVLISASFYRYTAKKPVSKVSSSYHYLYGPGVVVPWKLTATRKVTVDICPSMTENLSIGTIKAALEVWEEPFVSKTKKLDIDVRSLVICKPFSDVDQHAIHFINSYLTVQGDNSYNPGFTMIQSDLSNGNIFDADIVILGSEIAKDSSFDLNEFNRVLSHEFGHFLGLDHQFDGPVSIMSYDSVYQLGTYDAGAITELYKN